MCLKKVLKDFTINGIKRLRLKYFWTIFLLVMRLSKSVIKISNGHITSNRHQFHIDIKSIHRRPNFNEFPRHFHVLFWCNFVEKKSTSFPRPFFGVISMVKKSTFFRRSFFGVILLVEKPTLFPHTFLEVISLLEISRFFPHTFLDVISLVRNPPCSHLLFSIKFQWPKNHYCFHVLFSTKLRRAKIRRRFWLSCKLMKTSEEVFLC